MGKDTYTTNEHHVCMNYDVEHEYRDKICHYRVKVAFLKGMWYSGCDVDLPTCGYGSPVMPIGKGYSTRKEAVNAGLKNIRKYLQSQHDRIADFGYHSGMDGVLTKGTPQMKYLNRLIKGIDQILRQPIELNLFD